MRATRGCASLYDFYRGLSRYYFVASKQEYLLELFVGITFGGKCLIGMALYGTS
jgi:hypothetical protein